MNYEKNLKEIRNRIPGFANLIEADKGVDWIDEIPPDEHNGVDVVIRTSTDPFIINGDIDPKEKAEENNYHNDACTIIFGAGTGYFTKAVLDKMKERHVVVLVEPVIHMLKIALRLNDYSKSIKAGSLLFASNREDLDYQLSLIEGGKNITQWLIPTEDYTKHRPAEYHHLLNHTLHLINQLKNNTGTISGAGHLIAMNDITNLPYVIKHRGVAELKDIFKDKPAILVSTGPSLQKNIHLLMDKDVQKRFVIIAVGQALRILLSYDIKPDFICSVDFGPVNFGHYKGLLDCKDIPLVSLNRSYQPILKHWEGPKFISVNLDGASVGTLSEFMMHKGGLLQGGSVAHMNFGLATHMGCNPIIMIGQDLALEDDGTSHHSLTDEAGSINFEGSNVKWKVNDPRSDIQGVHDLGPVQMTEGFFGKPVKTIGCYVSYKSTFERMFRDWKDKVTIINATEGGAKLNDTIQMTLEEVIEVYADPEYAYTDMSREVLKPLLTEVPNSKALVKESLVLIKKDIKDLKELISLAQQSLNVLKKLKGKNSVKKKFAKRIQHNFDATTKARTLVEKNPLISISVYWASKTITQNRYANASKEIKDQLKVKDQNDIEYFYTKEGREVLKIRIEANEIVMKASRDTAKKLLQAYEDTLVDMESLDKNGCLTYDSINPAPHLDDAEEYFKNGNWGHNLIEARRLFYKKRNDVALPHFKIYTRAQRLRKEAVDDATFTYGRKGKDKIIKYNHYLELAHKAGRKQIEGVPKKRDCQKSLGYLLKAEAFDSERTEAKWGIATIYHKLGNIEQAKGDFKRASEFQDRSIQAYKELIKDNPDNLRLKFELSQVYLFVGFAKDADKLFNEIFSSTTDYDFFLRHLAHLYFKTGMIAEAKLAIDAYCEKFPFDPRGTDLKKEVYECR
jgi:hypothetical protein